MAQRFPMPVRVSLQAVLVVALACLAFAFSAPSTARPAHAGTPPNRLDPPVSVAGIPGSTLIIHNLYWDSNWDADNPAFPMATLDDFSSKLVASPYLANLAQYGVTSYSFTGGDGPVGDCATRPPGATFSYFDLSGWILCEKHHLPSSRNATVWLVFPPAGTGQSSSCADGGSWEGYHAVTLLSIIPPDVPQTFALTTPQCDSNLDGLTRTASHEVVEAAIDPLPGLGWIDHSTAGFLGLDFGSLYTQGEAGDICDSVGAAGPPLSTPGRIGGGLYAVDYYWSNAAGSCVPVPDSVTLNTSGGPASVSASFDGIFHSLPFTTTVADGTSHDVQFPASLIDPSYPTGGRYLTSFASGTQLITAPTTFTASYDHQYFLETSVAGGVTVPAAAGLTPSGWQPAGSMVNVSTNGFVIQGPGDRLRFDHWSGAASGASASVSVLMSQPQSVSANYVAQHLLTFTASGLPPGVPWAVTVDGVSQNGPVSQWFDANAAVGFSFASPVADPVAGTRYSLASTSAGSPVSASAAMTVVGTYLSQRLLTVATSGLGTNQTHVFNGGLLLGLADDSHPLQAWLADGTALSLSADAIVTGPAGTQFFFGSFSPAAPASLTAPFSTTAGYSTIAMLIDQGLASGDISGPAAQFLATLDKQLFARAQQDLAAHNYRLALWDLGVFTALVAAESGHGVSPALAKQLELLAMADYHAALCAGQAAGQIGPREAAIDYAIYSRIVTFLGGTPLGPC